MLSRAVVVAPIESLAWEPPYTVGVALKKKKRRYKYGKVFQGGKIAPRLSPEEKVN